MKKLKTIFVSKTFFLSLIFLVFILTWYQVFLKSDNSRFSNEEEITGLIKSKKVTNNKITLELKSKENIILNYYVDTYDELNKLNDTLYEGIIITAHGTLNQPSNNTIPNTFNYKKYLKSKKIYYTFKADALEIVGDNSNFYYQFKHWLSKRIESIDDTGYIKAFVLGSKSEIDEEVFKTYQNNGITHLFAISGMHISLFSSILLFLLKKIHLKDNQAYPIILLFLLGYTFLVSFTASVVRAFTLYLLLYLNKRLKLGATTTRIFIYAIVLILLLNPFFILDIGFLYSSLTSFGLILFSDYLKTSNKVLALFKVSLIALLFSLPITINNFYEYNFLSILANIVIVPLVSTIIYPLSLITLILPFFHPILKFFLTILETISTILSSITWFKIILPKMPWFLIISYYFIIYLIFKAKKKRCVIFLIILLLGYKLSFNFDNNFYVYYLDVGQGDSILLISPRSRKAILIDTGGKKSVSYNEFPPNEYHISNNIITFLKSINIGKINTLITTHGDYDHMGESLNIVNNFKVGNVILNCGSLNELEQNLITLLDKKHIKYSKCINQLDISPIKLYFLNSGEYDNENDNSNVIYAKLNDYKFMFMGDAGVEKEEDILNKYNISVIDVLKIGHHGSKTSSSKEFITKIKPKYSIISVGKNNRYGHPNKEVLENLKDSKIYRTDQDGSIMFKIKNNKLKIKTCSP
ncbi:late competence protein ComEC (Membrane metal-binding protein and hydrolase of the metallo-beta-lactamase superfamily) [Coprobacillus sp. CAG:605]|nr:late competence protein ComEC (Membrane metal-binding protein and hydrolase of the metallo-beta-lactamase superfamily) [Coprobacillus sp. CAG:605]